MRNSGRIDEVVIMATPAVTFGSGMDELLPGKFNEKGCIMRCGKGRRNHLRSKGSGNRVSFDIIYIDLIEILAVIYHVWLIMSVCNKVVTANNCYSNSLCLRVTLIHHVSVLL